MTFDEMFKPRPPSPFPMAGMQAPPEPTFGTSMPGMEPPHADQRLDAMLRKLLEDI